MINLIICICAHNSLLLKITQLKIEYNPFAKGFRGSDLTGGGRRYACKNLMIDVKGM